MEKKPKVFVVHKAVFSGRVLEKQDGDIKLIFIDKMQLGFVPAGAQVSNPPAVDAVSVTLSDGRIFGQLSEPISCIPFNDHYVANIRQWVVPPPSSRR